MDLLVVPIHKHPEYLEKCCDLINSEWKRSTTARMYSLKSSCDNLPTSFILLLNNKVIGHAKISRIPSINEGIFVESVVIDKNERGKGYGAFLMKRIEEYCKHSLCLSVVYLTTKDQEGFYRKLGYSECEPVSIYGSPGIKGNTCNVNTKSLGPNKNVPMPPPLPAKNIPIQSINKTVMKKYI